MSGLYDAERLNGTMEVGRELAPVKLLGRPRPSGSPIGGVKDIDEDLKRLGGMTELRSDRLACCCDLTRQIDFVGDRWLSDMMYGMFCRLLRFDFVEEPPSPMGDALGEGSLR